MLMARDIDAELLESVRVRRRRLRDAFLGGSLGSRRTVGDNVTRFVVGIVLGAVICAGCAATSFVHAHTGSSSKSSSPTTSVTGPATSSPATGSGSP
jgi:hypothetical protein